MAADSLTDFSLSPDCKLLAPRGRPRVLALVFSPIDDGAGRFSLGRAFREVGVHTLLLNVPQRSYYLQGIPGLGGDLDECVANLRRIIATIDAPEVVAVGLSMGGYGAVLFGAMLGVQRVLSMAGETLLLLPGSRSRRNIGNRFAPAYPDLRPQIEAATGTRFHFLCGEQDLIDLYSAWRVRDLPNVGVHTVRNASHEIARWLAQRDALVPFLSDFVARGEIEEGLLDAGTAMTAETAASDLFEAQNAFLKRDLEGSLRLAEKAATALPDVALAQFQFGQALERLGRKDEAAARLRAAFELDGSAVLYRVVLARVLVALDECEEAGRLLDAAVAEAPRLALAHHVRGNLLARLGDHTGAVAAQQQAIALDATNASFHSALGRAYLAMGAAEKALEAFEKATAINPKEGYLLYLLGQARAALGMTDQAAQAFARAVELSPNNPTFRRALAELRPAA